MSMPIKEYRGEMLNHSETTKIRRTAGRRSGRGLSCVIFALGLAGCAYQGGIDSPATQKFTWISYLSGDDIKAACRDGSPEKYRLVYNARYDEQLRTYEVLADAIDDGGFLTARAQGKATITQLRLDNLLQPWEWQKAQARLEPQQMEALRASLRQAGFYGQPDVGLDLNSKGFYWAAVGCVNGRFYFNGWQHPSKGFETLAFPKILFAHDNNELKINPPRPLGPSDLRLSTGPSREAEGIPGFLVTVKEDGLSGGGLGLRDPF